MFLRIRNPGIASEEGFTLLGVSTTRNLNRIGTIGQFGSGSKYALAQLLRNNIPVTVISSNLKMEFYSQPRFVQGQKFNQVCVKYGGKDETGKSRSQNKELGYTTEMGINDWKKLGMSFREFVSNAIDGSTIAGSTYKDVDFKVVDSPRAKDGYTGVFLPLNEEIQKCWSSIDTMFLHFKNPNLLSEKLLPKKTQENKVLIYKKGVLVGYEDGESVFDYNLDDLQVDESRNASSWDIRYAVAKALGSSKPGQIASILNAQVEGRDIWESKLDYNYLYDMYESEEKRNEKKEVYQTAFRIIAGDNGIITQGTKHITEVVERKGFKPLKVSPSWFTALEKYEVPTEKTVLEGLEKEGIPESEPTPDMLKALDLVWDMLVKLEMTNNKSKPLVKGFTPIMSAESQTFGMYKNGTVYVHTDYDTVSTGLLKVMLEEVSHHITGATDMSRDLQDYLFRMIVKLYF